MAEHASGTFYITTPIYYVNAQPHIGHAYTTIAADALARFHRLLGENVLFLTGTDEHGQKNLEAAKAAGVSPQEHVNSKAAEFRTLFERMHCRFDRFIRTTEEEHIRVVQEVFVRLREREDIYKGQYEGWYCMPCETYFLEKDLDQGKCPDCRRPVQRAQTEAYFFRTSAYGERLLRAIETQPKLIAPESRRNEVVAFIQQGLHDACISRTASPWDIPVPGDPAQTVYVWFDALVNYLTAAGYTQDEAKFAQWWPPQVQVMAKDILVRFHGTIWLAMLMALGLPLPERIFAHGWWLSADETRGEDARDRKIAKSAGDLVNPYEIAQQIAEVSGATTDVSVDALRYFLLREVTFGLDGVYKIEAVMQRFNDDLANDLGNLLNRTLPLVERFVGGVIPPPGPSAGALATEIGSAATKAYQALMEVDFSSCLAAIWQLLSAANRFIDERAPWDLHKAGKTAELQATLYDLLDCLRVVGIMVSPFMPVVAEEIWSQLGLSGLSSARWDDCVAGRLLAGGSIARSRPIFPRIDLRRASIQFQSPREKMKQERPASVQEGATATTEISIEEFARMDLRVGEIVAAQPIPGKDRLLELMVSLGTETRTVVAGIAQQFAPAVLLGKRVVLVANLKRAKIGGVESHGMILAAGEQEPLALVTLDGDCPLGTKVR
ncbi:MAG: methionine--tRNA ligase [Candidatus Zipacnadales bacterium]